MFNELDCVILTAPIALEKTWDIPQGSPLLKSGPAGTAGPLLPGDVGTIVYVQGGGAAFEVEFLEPGGYTVALATVLPDQMRLATPEDLAADRFYRKAAAISPS